MRNELIRNVNARAYTIPAEQPESDGTFEWDQTTIVVVQITCGNTTGLGYSYTDASVAQLINTKLASVVKDKNLFDVYALFTAMIAHIRNIGQCGEAMAAVAAVDNALWDLKARILDVSLAELLGVMRKSVPVYGSGGFTTYTIEKLQSQLSKWAEQGFHWVKMKVGSNPEHDPERVRSARESIGSKCGLFVDANWAYDRKQALFMADEFAKYNVAWFEEPVNHHDLEGLQLIRDCAPSCMEIAAGEYGTTLDYFRNMLSSGAVDVLQVDATRCGISGFLDAAALCQAFHIPLSAHTAPSVHLHPCLAIEPLRHLEYFHDHVRIENMLFDGAARAEKGCITPDLNRPGMGLTLKEVDAERFRC